MAATLQQVSTSLHPNPVCQVRSNDSPNFSCSISVDSTAKYSISEDTLPWLTFVLTNNSDSVAQYVLKWNTPLEGFRNKFLKVYCNGQELRYEGIMVKRGDPDPASYDLILPGSSVSASVYLEEAYDLSKPGRYRVELDTSLMDVIPDQGGEFVPHEINDFKGQQLRCGPVEFDIAA